ncbi:MAG: hypothetical protein N3G21_11385 [Candidatus Hydrogenedentes bacterium]|nr:hypothetical protein [Candidatus Hydrogenedentota bacterium]
MNRRNFISYTLGILTSFYIYGCGPSEEYLKVKSALEQHPKIVQKGAKIGKINFITRENDKDKDLRFEAELLDINGNVIGKAEGFRVEGFGTRIFRVRFNDEPEPPPSERRRPRRFRQQENPQESPSPTPNNSSPR